MQFKDKGNLKEIVFEDTDTDTEKRFAERQFWALSELMTLIKSKKDREN